MANRGRAEDLLAKLLKCDIHDKELTTYCPTTKSVCCKKCLKKQKHSTCTQRHKNIDSGEFKVDQANLITQMKQYISEEEEDAKQISEFQNYIRNKSEEMRLFKENIIATILKLKGDMELAIDSVKKDAEDDVNQITKQMELTKTIMEKMSNTNGLMPSCVVVASIKTKQYRMVVDGIEANSKNYRSRMESGIRGAIKLEHPFFIEMYDRFNVKPEVNVALFEQQTSADYQGTQATLQMVAERQRETEASKQMLYQVYSNVIEMLEEYERRVGENHLPKSKLDVTDHSWKSYEDVKANLESQLVVFEAHRHSCPSEVTADVNTELRIKTIYWAAVREERSIPMSDTDNYIAHLYEILVRGSTHHQILNELKPKVTKKTIKKTLAHILRGKNAAANIDHYYMQNPTRKASSPTIRTTRDDSNFEMGRDRIKTANESLDLFLKSDVEEVMMALGDLK